MRGLWIVLCKDLLRKVRSPLAPIIFLLFPVVFALLIGLTFGQGGEKIAPIKIALVDEDRGLVAKLVRSSLSQSTVSQHFDAKVVDLPTAVRLVENNKVSALLRIPAGFSDSLFASRTTYLEVVKNPAQGLYPQIVEEFTRVLSLLGTAVVRLLGKPIQEISGSVRSGVPPSDAFISDVSVGISQTMKRIGRYAFPPAIRLETVVPAAEKQKDTGASPLRVALYVLPGMSVFALLMLALGSMADFTREGARGTLARQLIAPVPLSSVIIGKMASTGVLSMACVVVLTLITAIWASAGVSVVGFIALSVAFALASTGFAGLIQSLSRSERTGPVVGTILVMAMSMLGGSWIPLEALPQVVRKLSPYTMTYWASVGYRDLIFESASVSQILPNLGILVGLGAAFCVAAILLFRRQYRAGA